MNSKLNFLIFLTLITNSCQVFSSDPAANSIKSMVGEKYNLPQLSAQDKSFTPTIAEATFYNLWGLMPSAQANENPHDHILKIILNGQLEDACGLASTTLDTRDRNILKMLSIVMAEQITALRNTIPANNRRTAEILEEHRRKVSQNIEKIALLLAATQSTVATKDTLTPENKHLFRSALGQAIQNQEEFFGLITREHGAIIAALHALQERVESFSK